MLLFNFNVTGERPGRIVVLAHDREDAERLIQLCIQGYAPGYGLEMPNPPVEYRVSGEGLVAYCHLEDPHSCEKEPEKN